jgi:hypothetical protein
MGAAITKQTVRQLEPSDTADEIKKTTKIIKGVVVAWTLLCFIFFCYVGGANNAFLWSFLCTIQLMFHLPLINVDLPGNAAFFVNILMSLGRYELLPTEWMRNLFNLSLSPTPEPAFEQAGYTSTHAIVNSTTVFVAIWVLVAVWLFIGLLTVLGKACKSTCAQETAKKMADKTFWLISIRFYLMVCLILAVAGMHNMRYSNKADFSLVWSIFSVVTMFMFTSYVTVLYFGSSKTDPLVNKEKYGWLCDIVFLRKGDPKALLYLVVYLWRRVLFALVAAFMPQFYAGQVFVFLFMTLMMLTVLFKYQPFKINPNGGSNTLGWIAFGNELFLFVAGLALLPMSNLVREIDERWAIGRFFIAVVILCIIFNMLVLIIIAIEYTR